MSDSYWSTQGQTPAQPVLSGTPGDALLRPYLGLRGADGVSLSNPQIAQDAESLFPSYTATGNVMPAPPADFANPTPASFAKWHSAHQMAYVGAHGSSGTFTDGATTVAGRWATIGTAPAEPITIMVSADGKSLVMLNTLTPEDIAKLPLQDQIILAGLPEFRSRLAAQFSLRPAAGDGDPSTIRAQLKTLVTNAATSITSSPRFVAGKRADFLADPANRAPYYHYLFLGQLEVLSAKLDGMAIFSTDQIKAQIKDVMARYARLERYQNTPPPPAGQSRNSTDGDGALQHSISVFIQTESRLYDIAVQSAQIARTGMFGARRLDAAGLTFVLQNMNTQAAEAKAEAKTEEMSQNNRLLEDYTAMQKLLTTTLKAYTSTGHKTLVALGGATSATPMLNDLPEPKARNQSAAHMFDASYAKGGSPANIFHPFEREKGITRPLLALINGAGLHRHDKRIWDKFSVDMGEVTKQIGQDTQLRMDEINQLNKAKNRHYELASNVLNKSGELLRAMTSF